MELQFVAPYLIALIPFAAADSIITEGLRLKQFNFQDYRRCKNLPQIMVNPLEYMKTPHFDILLLSEDNSNPMWRKYADLFQPIDLRNAQRIEVSYGKNTFPFADGFHAPSISLNRFEVESVLARLGHKKHIIVLRPRDCKPFYTRRAIEKHLMNEFKNEFLRKLLQQLHEGKRTRQAESDSMEPIVQRILEGLDEGDRKMINDVKERFEEKAFRRSRVDYLFSANAPDNPCHENYVFLLQNQENPADPNSLNDLLLRVLRVVTTETTESPQDE